MSYFCERTGGFAPLEAFVLSILLQYTWLTPASCNEDRSVSALSYNVAGYVYDTIQANGPAGEYMVQGLSVVRILLYSSCAIGYTLIAGLFLRDYRKRKTQWGGTPYVCLALANAFIYSFNITTAVLPVPELRFALLIRTSCIFLVPPLLSHLFYHNEKGHLPAPRLWPSGWDWRTALLPHGH